MTSLPSGTRALGGLFQALTVRSGGFYVVSIAGLRIGLLILYVIMMYISAYPVLITMRNSNVYEERSLGIYADDPHAKKVAITNQGFLGRLKRTLTKQQGPTESRGYFIRQQIRGQLLTTYGGSFSPSSSSPSPRRANSSAILSLTLSSTSYSKSSRDTAASASAWVYRMPHIPSAGGGMRSVSLFSAPSC